jgi:hypothetical protein
MTLTRRRRRRRRRALLPGGRLCLLGRTTALESRGFGHFLAIPGVLEGRSVSTL